MHLHLQYRIPLGELWLWLNYLYIYTFFNSSKDELINAYLVHSLTGQLCGHPGKAKQKGGKKQFCEVYFTDACPLSSGSFIFFPLLQFLSLKSG